MTYQALNKYKQNTVTTATPEELTLMLYDGAIKFMNIAKYSMENKDLERTHFSLVRAQDIISELNYSLDMNYDLSKDMRVLYDFILGKLVDSNISKDIKALEEALEITHDMRDTWKEVMQELRQKVYPVK